MRNDIEETIRRSLIIKDLTQGLPKKGRKELVTSLLAEKDWTADLSHYQELGKKSFIAKILLSRLLAKQIINYGYAWLPDTVKESGKRIAATTPILMTLNMVLRFSLIPLFFASNLPPSPHISFALHALATWFVHENEVKILKETPVVLNQYVSTLSFFFQPRLASLLFRFPTLLLHATFLLKPTELPFISTLDLDKALSAYYYYVFFWFLVVEGAGSVILHWLLDKNKTNELKWDDE